MSLPNKKSPQYLAPPEEIRIVLLGKTGTGKSRTGCSILGIHRTFIWTLQPTSTTNKCELKTANRFNKKIDVVDTPGIFDTERTNEDLQEEIKKCITLTTPGPHAILLCVQMGKFTREDIATVAHFKYFGEELIKYVIIVFTRADDWEREQHDLGTNMDIKTYVQGLPKDPKRFLQKCNNRFILWNNRLENRFMDSQVQTLLQKIDIMIEDNNSSWYTNEDYKKAEEALQSLIMTKYLQPITKRAQADSDVPSVYTSLGYGNDFDSSSENDYGNDFGSASENDYGNNFDSSSESVFDNSSDSDPGIPYSERDRAKTSDVFYKTVITLLVTLAVKIADFKAWLWS